MRSSLTLPVLLVLLFLGPPVAAQTAEAPAAAPAVEAAAELPRVHVIATGGTIAGAGYQEVDSLDAAALVAAVPELGAVARLSVEDPFTVPSSQLTPEMLHGLAGLVRKRLDEDPELAGVVVTQGTDSLEEGAFFLDLLLDSERPVVFTGAMRLPGQVGADGGRNLLAAVRLAASKAARGLGVLVTMNDEIHAAREVRKLDSTAVDAFGSPGTGPLGFLDGERIYLASRPARRLSIPTATIEPRVDLIPVTAGGDERLLRAAVESGARGVVLELFGRGNMPRAMIPEVAKARQQGVIVVFASRTGGGALRIDPRWSSGGIVYAEALDGLKARLALIVALGSQADPAALQQIFDRLAGRVL